LEKLKKKSTRTDKILIYSRKRKFSQPLFSILQEKQNKRKNKKKKKVEANPLSCFTCIFLNCGKSLEIITSTGNNVIFYTL
jgi:hypothetical protein